MSTEYKSSNVQNVIANAFGNVAQAPTDNPPIKENVISFRKNKVYLSLNLKSYYDSKKGTYTELTPRLTSSADGVFCNLPSDSEFLKDYGEFILKLADTLDGIMIDNSVINYDVGNAKRMLQRFVTLILVHDRDIDSEHFEGSQHLVDEYMNYIETLSLDVDHLIQ